MLFLCCIFSQNTKTVPDVSTLPDRAPQLRRSTSTEVHLGSDTYIHVSEAPGRVYVKSKTHPLPTPLPEKMEETTGDVHTTATRTTVSMVPLELLLDEFPDSIAETISKELDKLVN